ncbi:hypothetical protein Tco_0065767 [Tanacetum coccineum]
MRLERGLPPFEEPLDDVFFPLPEVDILPIEVEPVEVMFNDSHTYGENISQVERKFLSMVDELFNLSNDDETFDPGGGEIDVLLNKGENNDLNERIEKTKRSKNDQKLTRNERDKNKSEESAKDQSRISRHSNEGSQRTKVAKEEKCFIKEEKEEENNKD